MVLYIFYLVIIILSVIISSLLWSDLKNSFVWTGLFTLIIFGIVGIVDDYKKIKTNSSNGLKAITRIIQVLPSGFEPESLA